MLFCVSCQKEGAKPQLSKGTFYTSDGKQYNTHVKIKITSNELTTAATTLSAEMQNNTDYIILLHTNPEEYP